MTNLEQLIQTHCPNGVEYKSIYETVGLNRGRRLTKSQLSENGKYEVYHGSKDTILGKYEKSNAPAGTVIVVNTGGIGGVKYLSEPFWCSDGSFWLGQHDDINSKYLYYCLVRYEDYFASQKREGGVPTIDRSVVENFKIPVPPLPVQEEIVRILDKFTKLEAELAQELAQELAHRKQQYAFYRDRLLSFESPIIVKTLEELGVFYGGLTGKTKDDFSDGNAKFITYMNVFKNSELDQNANNKVKIDKNEKQHKVQFGDVLFTGSSETRDECGMSSVVTHEPTEDMYLNSFCFGYRLNDTAMFNPHFLKHLFRSDILRKQIIKTANGVTRFNVSKEKMKQIKIPVPPMNVQNRLAYVLDNFDAICSDLSIGLPAEIAAREKQYNYYRDLLFNYAADMAGFKQSTAEHSRAQQSTAEHSRAQQSKN